MPIVRTCQNPKCNKIFNTDPSHANKKFCCRDCQKAMRIPKVCAKCGREFMTLPSKPDRQFCSRACIDWTLVYERVTRTCLTCGKTFETLPSDTRVHYCGVQCSNGRNKQPDQTKTCVHCSKSFTVEYGLRNRKYCSHGCMLELKRRQEKTCQQCGVIFKPNTSDQLYCTPACMRLSRRRPLEMSCGNCGKTFTTYPALAHRRRYCSKKCRMVHQFHSHEEDTVVNYARILLNETPERQRAFPWLISSFGGSMHIDAYFPGRQLAIEYDGKQHREFMPYYHVTQEQFDRLQQRDREKEALLTEHGITLIRIRDDEPRTPEHIWLRLSEYVEGSTLLPVFGK